MDNTKELLKKAAMAAGINLIWRDGKETPLVQSPRRAVDYLAWRPDEDDGDSARLADALGIDVCYRPGRVVAVIETGNYAYEYVNNHNNDRAAARRMAVLRLAASMGDGV